MGTGGKGLGGGGFGTKKRFIQALTSGEAGNRPLNRRVAAALAEDPCGRFVATCRR